MMYEPVIGLEVHVQLKTKTKIFCGCPTEFGAQANSQTCPVCLGLPGVLPVLNEKALDYAIKVAAALNCKLQPTIKFDRKNYFYPDLPKNFQISQYDLPLALDGWLEIKNKRIGIKRIHLEEDAGKLIHRDDCSLIDFNRAGIPLLEIVSEPQIYSSQEAFDYLSDLKSIIRYLDVSDCDMEKGSLRCDANISLRKKGAKGLGVKTEIKNMNSFKSIKQALEFEIERQNQIFAQGEETTQETRFWDSGKEKTFSMRTKEGAQDYRYFPEPDLPYFVIHKAKLERVKASLPELPKQKLLRFKKTYRLSDYDASIIISEKKLADYFQGCAAIYKDTKNISNWITGPLLSELNKRAMSINDLKIPPDYLIALIKLVDEGKINNLTAKDVLSDMFDSDNNPEVIINKKNLLQISDEGYLHSIVDSVIKNNTKSINDYKSGKTNAIMFLVGQVMKQTKGKANPKVVRQILEKRLKRGG